MVRYVGNYVCRDCGHEFIGMDMEWNCTAASCPVYCPECGSPHTAPLSGSLIGRIFKLLKL